MARGATGNVTVIKLTPKTDLGQIGFVQWLSILQERAEHLGPALEVIKSRMLQSTANNFAAQGRPVPWDPLKPDTLARRKSRNQRDSAHPDKKQRRNKKPTSSSELILLDLGRLQQAATDPSTITVNPTSVVVRYANLIYARFQQKGYDPQNVPARPYVVVQPGDIPRWGRVVKAYLVNGRPPR